jgi:hypothetical protein
VTTLASLTYAPQVDPNQATQGLRQIEGAADSLGAAIEQTDQRITRSNRSFDSLARSLSPVQRAFQDLERVEQRYATQREQAIAAAQREGVAQEKLAATLSQSARAQEQAMLRAVQGLERQQQAAVLVAAGHVDLARSLDNSSGVFGRYGSQVQNASFQLQDFFVQVQSGQSWVTALAQQLPQLLGGFGMAEAIAGAAVAIGAVAANAATAAINGKDLEQVLKDIDVASKLAEEAAERRVRGLEDEAERLNNLAAAYRNYSQEALAGERSRMMAEQTSLTRSTRSTLSSLDSSLLGATSLRTSLEAARYSGEGQIASPIEQAALDRLNSLNDIASITRERLLEVRAAADAAAQANGSLSSAFAGVVVQLDRQMGPLTEAGERTRFLQSNLALLGDAAPAAAEGVTGVGKAAAGATPQAAGLNTELGRALTYLQRLNAAKLDNPYTDLDRQLATLRAQASALARGDNDAAEEIERRDQARVQAAEQRNRLLDEEGDLLRKNGATAEEIAAARQVSEARIAAQQGEIYRQQEANRAAEKANSEREAQARRDAAAAQRDTNKEMQEALRLQAQFYSQPTMTRSGLLSLGTFDDKAIQQIQQDLRAKGLDPESREKAEEKVAKAAERAYDQQQRKAEATFDRISDYAGNAFADVFLNTEGGWKRTMENLERVAIATFAKIAFEAAARPIIMPVVQAFTGTSGTLGGTMTGLANVSGGSVNLPVTDSSGTVIGYAQQGIQGYSLSSQLGSSNPLVPGYTFSSGLLGRADSFLGTNIGGFLDAPVYGSVSGSVTNSALSTMGSGPASQLVDVNGVPYTNTQLYGPASAGQVAQAGGNTLTYGQAAAGGLSVLGGAYGIYSGIQTGGAKGFAQGVGGAAGVVGGGASLAAGSASALGLTGGAVTALGAVAAVAPYIAAIAAIVAMFLPGQKPSDRTGTALVNTATGETVAGGLTGDRYSQENRDTAASLGTAVKQLSDQMSSSYGITPYGRYIVGTGDRDGYFWQTSERHEYGSDEASVQQMLKDVSRDLLENNAWQLQGNLRTTYNTVGTGDIDKLLQALDWTNTTYKAFQDNLDPEKPTQFAQSLQQISDAYGPLIDKAREYGLAIEPIADVMQEQIGKLTEARNLQFNQMIAGYSLTAAQLRGDTGATLGLQLQQFDLQRTADYTALVDQIKDMGLGADQLTQAVRSFDEVKDLQRQAVIDQSNAAKAQQEAAAAQERSAAAGNVVNVMSGITDYIRNLRVGSDSSLTASARFSEAERVLQAVGGAAAAGDYNSARQFTSVADAYRQAAGAYGAGPGRAAADARILDFAERISSVSADTLTISAMASIARDQATATSAPIVDAIQQLRAENQALRLSLDGFMRRAS